MKTILPHRDRVVAVLGLEAERVRLGVRERAVEILGRRLRDVDRQRDAALEGDVDADAAAQPRLDQLREHAARRVGMDERDLEAEGAAARRLVDQLGAVAGEPLELRADVVDLERDVVHPRPALGEELPDRRLRAERPEQLDAAAADAHRHGLDALVGDRLALLELGAEEALVALDGLVEVGDRDAEVVDAGRGHRRRC